MSDKKRPLGLGRGLAALLEEIGPSSARGDDTGAAASDGTPPALVPVASISPNPNQPRREFDETELQQLSSSIRTHGLVQPLLLRPAPNGGYEIVAGERRWRAAQMAQIHEVPAVVRPMDDATAYQIAIVENVQRADLNPVEEARAYDRLTSDYGHSAEAIGTLVGKSRSHIANMMRLLKLPNRALDLLRDGQLSVGHARALVGREDAADLAEDIVDQNLSVREVEELVAGRRNRERQSRPRPTARSGEKDPDTAALEAALSDATGLKVSIAGSGATGRVVIDYTDLDQLDMLVQRLIGGRF